MTGSACYPFVHKIKGLRKCSNPRGPRQREVPYPEKDLYIMEGTHHSRGAGALGPEKNAPLSEYSARAKP